MTIRMAIIGYGKIAQDQHRPAILGNPSYTLAAIVNPNRDPRIGVPWFASLAELVAAGLADAVAICTPPVPRYAIAKEALAAGLDVLLEKPPAATLGELDDMLELARQAKRTLYAGWHSQHAPAVAPAAKALEGAQVRRLRIEWREDVRKWHPGQEWIWAPGGFGVFDPGINALSIASRILPMPLFVASATLAFPANRQAPIAAQLAFVGPKDALSAEMDWRYEEGEHWTIEVETGDGRKLALRDGGAGLSIDGVEQKVDEIGEYPSIYARFAELAGTGTVEVDGAPLRIVADAFMVGAREIVEAFT